MRKNVDVFLERLGNYQVTQHFKLSELIVTNKYDLQESCQLISAFSNLVFGCERILEPLRYILNRPLIITSGLRSSQLNKVVGGVYNSQHLNGCAVDVLFSSSRENEITLIKKSFDAALLPFDQFIVYEKFFHISWNPSGFPRGQVIFKYPLNKKLTYEQKDN